ncbi:MAG: hypothetical protein HYZ53_04465 [Planctomycetes bacterium]|nr:hypothetical protein [Planctomycetota bacterium]
MFLKLSALLTGFEDLDPLLGEDYLQRLEPLYGAEIGELCKLYYENIREADPLAALNVELTAKAALAVAARQIVTIWLLSLFNDPNPANKAPILAGHFERGLLWRLIDAHPPAFSFGRHGYWAKPPHNS